MNKLQKGLAAGALCLASVFTAAAFYVPEQEAITGKLNWYTVKDGMMATAFVTHNDGERKSYNVESMKIRIRDNQEMMALVGSEVRAQSSENALVYYWHIAAARSECANRNLKVAGNILKTQGAAADFGNVFSYLGEAVHPSHSCIVPTHTASTFTLDRVFYAP